MNAFLPSSRPRSLILLSPEAARDLYGEAGLAEIAALTEPVSAPVTPTEVNERREMLATVEVLFTGWGLRPIDAAFLAAAPRLKAIFFAGGTIRSWITPAVWERGIVVCSAYGANALPVAEYTVAVMVLSLKRAWHYFGLHQREKIYPLPTVPAPGTLGAVVGLISLGAIGRLVLSRLRSFELEVIASDPSLTLEDAAELGVEKVELDELFSRSDIVSLHAPLLPATRGLVTGAHFDRMRPGATFINTARGAIVREEEMADVFSRRPDLTAVLDVLAVEPPAPDNPLLRLPNIMITPHIAGALGSERARLGRFMLEEFKRWRDGTPLHWQITPEKADFLA